MTFSFLSLRESREKNENFLSLGKEKNMLFSFLSREGKIYIYKYINFRFPDGQRGKVRRA